MHSSNRLLLVALGFTAVPLLFAACGGSDSARFTAGSGGSPGSGGSGDSGEGGEAGEASGGASSGGSKGSGGAASGGTSNQGGDTGAGAPNAGGDGGDSGGAGGMAGAGGGCADADSDGETTCAGDCDDGDPNNFTTNVEQCGDLADNNCDATADEGCGGIGTYVSLAIGKANSPGTRTQPVDTIAGGMANALQILAGRGSGSIDVFVADGHYTEKVTLSENVNLRGGHQCSQQSCTWTRNPAMYDTAVFGTDADGMLATDAITRATRVDGFRLMGQNGGAVGRGRAALTLRNGTPTISNNRIFAPNVTGSGTAARAHGILITNGTNQVSGALIQRNEINIDPNGLSSPGQTNELSSGILLEQNGMANPAAAAEIRGNEIRGGAGRLSNGITASGTSAALVIDGNDIVAGNSTERSFAVQVFGTAKLNDNLINVTAPVPTCGGANWCGGIQSQSATLTITNNVILGVNGLWSTGVFLMEAEIPGGKVILNSNTIDGTGQAASIAGSRSAGLAVWIGTCAGCGFNGFVGEVRNNILIGGTAESRVSVFEDPSPTRTQHPLFLQNNVLYVDTSGQGTGSLYRLMAANGTQTLLTTQAEVNNLGTTVGGMTAGSNLAADPTLNATFHLIAGSPAIGQATANDAPSTDMDGQPRPQGSGDIGADEVP